MVIKLQRSTRVAWTIWNDKLNSEESNNSLDPIQNYVKELVQIELNKQLDLNSIKSDVFTQFELEFLPWIKSKVDIDTKTIIYDEFSKRDWNQIKMIETLAIFVSLFTFISIDFQIFKKDDIGIFSLGLVLILLWGLLFFNMILSMTISNIYNKSSKDKPNKKNEREEKYFHDKLDIWIILTCLFIVWIWLSIYWSILQQKQEELWKKTIETPNKIIDKALDKK